LADRAVGAARKVPPEIEARMRSVVDTDEYRARITEAMAALDRGERGRVVRESQPFERRALCLNA
jgi:hypothetical protein